MALSTETFTLDDDSALATVAETRIRRWTRALWPAGIDAELRANDCFGAPDIFRLAQVYFDIHGRLLTVRPPLERGIIHWSYPLPIRLDGWRNIYTVHDAIPLVAPSLSPIDRKRHRRLLDRVGETADVVVTVSGSARSEIAEAMGWQPNSIIDCSEAVTPIQARRPLPSELQQGAFLLVLGAVDPRKNINRLLAGHLASRCELPLVIAGPATTHGHDLERAIEKTPRVFRYPQASTEEVAALLAGARALLMPSLAEGFGLPVVEAMSAGTPVVTSNRGALAETAGEAALLVDPEDVNSIAAAIRMITQDDSLRDKLIQAGYTRAGQFTPEQFSARLDALYSRLIASSAAPL